jgi:aspartyl-tRNA(Asn)/glutamyl-tRNA(Gln) amidotransferase subunit C
MAKLDKENIKTLSKLCRIKCNEEEQAALLENMQKILAYVEQLQEINTENVKPLNHVLVDVANVMREDVVGETLPREVFLKNAPDKISGLIRVPPVIKKQQ